MGWEAIVKYTVAAEHLEGLVKVLSNQIISDYLLTQKLLSSLQK